MITVGLIMIQISMETDLSIALAGLTKLRMSERWFVVAWRRLHMRAASEEVILWVSRS